MPDSIREYSHVLVTGGSSGIGKAFIKELSSKNFTGNIGNISRTKPKFTSAAIRCQHFPADLTQADRLLQFFYVLEPWLDSEDEGKPGKILLVNNSGFGSYGPFSEEPVDSQLEMIDLNVRAVVQLTGLLLPRILQRGGGVVNVASTASFQPLAYMATYAATKSFLQSWGMALHQEIKSQGAFCLTHCPGPTSTAFFKRAGFKDSPLTGGMGQTSEAVARSILKGVENRESLRISGFHNWILAGLGGTLPRRLVAPLASGLVRSLRLDRKLDKTAP